MHNPYELKTVFTLREAANAIAGVIRVTREDQQKCKLILSELIEAAKRQEFHVERVIEYSRRRVEGWTGEYRTVQEPIGTVWESCRIARADLIAWCKSRNQYPPLLSADHLHPKANAELTPKAEGKVLELLAAMLWKEYGADWPNRDRETFLAELQNDLAKAGINLNVDKRTWRGHLSKAAAKMEILLGDSNK